MQRKLNTSCDKLNNHMEHGFVCSFEDGSEITRTERFALFVALAFSH